MATKQDSKPHKAPTYFDWLKPRRGEAIARLRNNGFATVVVLISAQLLPIIPSPFTCLVLLVTGGRNMGLGTRVACWSELAVLGLLALNMLQASYAIRYPPPPLAPLPSPATRAQVRTPAARRFKPTAPSPSSSLRDRASLSTAYAPSPFSTPSGVLNYKAPSPSPNQSFASTASLRSSSSFLMSSPLAAYRGRHAQPAGRPVDGALLNFLQDADEDEDEDD